MTEFIYGFLTAWALWALIDSLHTFREWEGEHETGRWIIVNIPPSVGTHCSMCGWAWSDHIDAVKLNPALSLIKTNFCPNCGAKMEGAK